MREMLDQLSMVPERGKVRLMEMMLGLSIKTITRATLAETISEETILRMQYSYDIVSITYS